LTKVLIVTDSLPTKSFPRANIFALDQGSSFLKDGNEVFYLILHRLYINRQSNILQNIKDRILQYVELKSLVAYNIELKPYFSIMKPFVFKEDLFLFGGSKFSRTDFDIIIVHFMVHPGLAINWIRDKIVSKKYILYSHSDWRYFNSMVSYFCRYYIKYYDHVWVTSNEQKDILKRLTTNRITVNPPIHYINTEDINKAYTLEFLTVSNLISIKGFDKMMAFFTELNKYDTSWKWRIIGHGILRNDIKKWIQENNFIRNVVIISELAKPHLLKEYKKASYYIQLSERETYGISPKEAYHFKCKLIISNNIPSVCNISSTRIYKYDGNGINKKILEFLNIESID